MLNHYQILKTALYESIVLSLLRRHILSLDEAIGCLKDIDNDSKVLIDLNKEITMVKQKGLSNTRTAKSEMETIDNE